MKRQHHVIPFLTKHFSFGVQTDKSLQWPWSHMVHSCSQRKKTFTSQECCSELRSLTVTTTETNLPVHPTSLITRTNGHIPQDYATGYLYPYSKEEWHGWLKQYSLQGNKRRKLSWAFQIAVNNTYKICTGKNCNEESDTGVLEWQGKGKAYCCGDHHRFMWKAIKSVMCPKSHRLWTI